MINTARQRSETFLHDTTQSGLQKPVPTTHDNLLFSFSLLYSNNNIFDAFFFIRISNTFDVFVKIGGSYS